MKGDYDAIYEKMVVLLIESETKTMTRSSGGDDSPHWQRFLRRDWERGGLRFVILLIVGLSALQLYLSKRHRMF